MPVEIKSSSLIKKDYEQKQFTNPYFENQKKPKKFNTGLYLKIISLILVVYVLIYSDLFKIKQIDISGNEMIETEKINGMVNDYLNSFRWLLLPQRNFLFLDQQGLTNKIEEEFNLASLNINKRWQGLDITIKEKPSNIIIHNLANESFFLGDINGELLKNIQFDTISTDYRNFPIFDLSDQNMVLGDRVVSGRVVSFIIDLHNVLKESNLIKIKNYEVKDQTKNEITLKTGEGWSAYFDISNDPKASAINLLTVLNEKIKNQKVEYIDLRFGDKVYYK